MTNKKISTDTQLRALKPENKPYTRSITAKNLVKGTLLVVVNPQGTKTFRTRYRFNKKQQGHKHGNYPTISLKRAVEKHNKVMSLLDEKIDPKEYFLHELVENKASPTMNDLIDKWLASRMSNTDLKPATNASHKWRWEKYLQPELGTLKVKKIERAHLAIALETARKASREETRKSISTLKLAFDYALSRGLISDNPASSIKPKQFFASPTQPRERWLRMDEIELLWTHLSTGKSKVSLQTSSAIKIALLTGCRRAEVAEMEVCELDLEAGVWELPASRSKNKNSHTYFLHPEAISILRNLICNDSQVFVFNSVACDEDSPMSPDVLTRAIKRLSSTLELDEFTFHDIRRSAATNWCEELGADTGLIELMLNHIPHNKLVQTYQRGKRLEQQKTVWLDWGDLIHQHKYSKLAKTS